MAVYTPDRWVILKIESPSEVIYKVLAGWTGSYLYGASWKLNSGIKKARIKSSCYEFDGYSGSLYRCNKRQYGLTVLSAEILDKILERAKGTDMKVTEIPEEMVDNVCAGFV